MSTKSMTALQKYVEVEYLKTLSYKEINELFRQLNERIRELEDASEVKFYTQPRVIRRLIYLRDSLAEARNLICTCSGKIICECGKQHKINAREKALWNEIVSL